MAYTEEDAEAMLRGTHADFTGHALYSEYEGHTRWHVQHFTVYRRHRDNTYWGIQYAEPVGDGGAWEYDPPFQVEPHEVTKTTWRPLTRVRIPDLAYENSRQLRYQKGTG